MLLKILGIPIEVGLGYGLRIGQNVTIDEYKFDIVKSFKYEQKNASLVQLIVQLNCKIEKKMFCDSITAIFCYLDNNVATKKSIEVHKAKLGVI